MFQITPSLVVLILEKLVFIAGLLSSQKPCFIQCIIYKFSLRGINRVVHNNVFFSFDLGGLGISDHTQNIHCDFFWEFFGVIFIAA